jgi:hypothetical protein
VGTANIVPGFVDSDYGRDSAPLFSQSADGENLSTTNASSTASTVTAPSKNDAACGGRSIAFRVMLSEEGYVRVNGTAAVGTGMRCIADVEYFFPANNGDTISVRDTA